jgi:murein L,D-transpeptidase YafK
MNRRTLLLTAAVGLALTACGHNKFLTYDGPPVTAIVVQKANRKMFLLNGNTVLKDYDIQLGGNPIGPKQFEGDGKTPEGQYFISLRNPNSRYHLSLRVSYPNDTDREYAKSMERQPGGDIFIHGIGDTPGRKRGDWTAGCIAVKDKEIEVIYSMIREGTPIFIYP